MLCSRRLTLCGTHRAWSLAFFCWRFSPLATDFVRPPFLSHWLSATNTAHGGLDPLDSRPVCVLRLSIFSGWFVLYPPLPVSLFWHAVAPKAASVLDFRALSLHPLGP